MEEFKAIIAECLSPMIIALMLQFIGWLVIWKQKKRSGLALIGVGTAVLSIGGLSGLTHEARRNMEYAFEPFDVTDPNPARPARIFVLGTGCNDDPQMPANSQVSGTFLSRILEGARIYRSSPNARLLISVAGEASLQSKQSFLASMRDLLQLDADRVGLITTAESTADEAVAASEQLGEEQLILVTSAAHMKRAVAIFADADLRPAAAPTSYQFVRAGTSNDSALRRWIPSTSGVNGNHQWLYENVALLWHNVRGN